MIRLGEIVFFGFDLFVFDFIVIGCLFEFCLTRASFAVIIFVMFTLAAWFKFTFGICGCGVFVWIVLGVMFVSRCFFGGDLNLVCFNDFGCLLLLRVWVFGFGFYWVVLFGFELFCWFVSCLVFMGFDFGWIWVCLL